MAHHHHDTDDDTYYLDQLCLIGITGAFALICITMYTWQFDMLKRLLAPQFYEIVLASGIALLILVVIRSVILWRSVGAPAPTNHTHEHDHAHSHDHNHDHSHSHDHPHDHGHGHERAHSHAHDHGHAHHDHDDGHEHSWAPWRYVVLLIPVALYLLGQPDKGPSAEDDTTQVSLAQEVTKLGIVSAGPLPFHQAVLTAGAFADPFARDVPIFLAGKPASLGDLKADMPVSLKLYDDRKIKIEIVQEVHANPTAAIEARKIVHGKITEVDVAEKMLKVTASDGSAKEYDLALGPAFGMDFKTLESLAFREGLRRDYNGKTVQVVGQFAPRGDSDRIFTLVRHRMQCCVGDAIQLNVPIVSREPLKGFQRDQFVKVTGRVEFAENPTKPGQFRTILRVSRGRYVEPTDADPEPYVR